VCLPALDIPCASKRSVEPVYALHRYECTSDPEPLRGETSWREGEGESSVFRVEIIGPPIEKPSTLRSLAARDMPYATFVGAWDVASIGFAGRFALQNIPILCNTIMLFHIDTCRLHPARARLYEGRFAVASAGYPLLHQLNEWEIASLFSHAAGPTESTFDGQNLHPQPRYGGRSSRPRSPNPLSAAIYVLDESRFNDEVPAYQSASQRLHWLFHPQLGGKPPAHRIHFCQPFAAPKRYVLSLLFYSNY
jgi:hypothetical protein